jgi:hypothetical protein
MGMAAGLFFFGAILHAGIGIGPLREPHILPAVIVETGCGLVLLLAVLGLVVQRSWMAALFANCTAFATVVMEVAVQTVLAGPGAASRPEGSFFPDGYVYVMNGDFYHGTLLALITISLLILCVRRSAFR